MNEIVSVNNELIKSTAKLLQKKYRDESGLFLLEGEKAVFEAINFGVKIKDIFINKKNEKLLSKCKNYSFYTVNDKVLAKITDAKTPPDIIAVAHKFDNDISKIPNKDSIILLLENIKDAGNLGTAIRTASAFNIDGIVLLGETVDLFSPKVVRSSVGYLWKTPIVKVEDIASVKKYFDGYEFFATSVDEKLDLKVLKQANIKSQSVIMFGSEAFGLSEKTIKSADTFINIPIKSDIESLNLSIAIGIVLYEIRR